MAKPKRKRPEEEAQKACVTFLRNIRKLGMPIQFLHVPGELLRTKTLRLIYWAMGVESGVPDLVLFIRGTVVFVELKIKGNYPSPTQKEWMQTVKDQGFDVRVVTVEYPHEAVHQIAKIITEYGVKC